MNTPRKRHNLQIAILAALTTAAILTIAVACSPFGKDEPPPPPLGDSSDTTHFTNLAAEDLTLSDDLTVADDATVTGDLTVSTTAAITSLNPTIDATALTTDTTILATQTGELFTNQGASGAVVASLPAAAAGQVFCFYTHAAQNFDINPDDADQIHHLTNAVGDAIRNATAGDKVCLWAIDATNWVSIEEHGTWSDVN